MKPALLLAALLLVPGTAALPFLQEGADAARTGQAQDPGPETFDLAFAVSLNDKASNNVDSVIILDRSAYTITSQNLWRIDLDTADVESLVFLESPNPEEEIDGVGPADDVLTGTGAGEIDGLASDGERFFLVQNGLLHAYTLSGDPAWDVFPLVGEPLGSAFPACKAPAIAHDRVFIACYYNIGSGTGGIPGRAVFQVISADRETGTGVQRWASDFGDETGVGLTSTGSSGSPTVDIISTAVIGDEYIVSTIRPHGLVVAQSVDREAPRAELWAFSVADLALQWRFRQPVDGLITERDPADSANAVSTVPRMGVTGAAGRVFVNGMNLYALTGDGGIDWSQSLQPSASIAASDTSAGVAVIGTDVIAASSNSLYRIDGITGEIKWQTQVPMAPTNEANILIAGSSIFVEESSRLRAVTLAGESVWSRQLSSPTYAIGDGVLAVMASDPAATGDADKLYVYGKTAASIGFDAAISTLFPTRGETVSLTIRDPDAGIFGPPDAYQIDWGDGTVTTLQSPGSESHVYHIASDWPIRVRATNADGQEASRSFTVFVDGTPPANLNWAQKTLEPENYDLTFGLLGIFLAVVGGFIALVRSRARRGRISTELNAIERAATASNNNPSERSAAMNERRAHVRGLLLDGRIDESQLKILEDRIDELARGGRMEALHGRFDFLPYGFVRQVQEMLSDGRLSGWEYDQLGKVLASDDSLTTAQKKRVRVLLADWAKEDA